MIRVVIIFVITIRIICYSMNYSSVDKRIEFKLGLRQNGLLMVHTKKLPTMKYAKKINHLTTIQSNSLLLYYSFQY